MSESEVVIPERYFRVVVTRWGKDETPHQMDLHVMAHSLTIVGDDVLCFMLYDQGQEKDGTVGYAARVTRAFADWDDVEEIQMPATAGKLH